MSEVVEGEYGMYDERIDEKSLLWCEERSHGNSDQSLRQVHSGDSDEMVDGS